MLQQAAAAEADALPAAKAEPRRTRAHLDATRRYPIFPSVRLAIII